MIKKKEKKKDQMSAEGGERDVGGGTLSL